MMKALELDFVEHQVERYPGEHALSQEDGKFLKITSEGISHDDGHYTLPLPFQEDNIDLPSNRSKTLTRRRKW